MGPPGCARRVHESPVPHWYPSKLKMVYTAVPGEPLDLTSSKPPVLPNVLPLSVPLRDDDPYCQPMEARLLKAKGYKTELPGRK